MNKSVFLDRDGTMAPDLHYCGNPGEFVLFQNTPKAVRLLNRSGFVVVVITNQSGIGRGYFTEKDLFAVHRKMRELLAYGGAYVDAIYYCPHDPEDNCDCRKPKSKLLLQAAKDWNIDLSKSYVIGDSQMDVDLGENIGCRTMLISENFDLLDIARCIVEMQNA